MVFNCVFNQSVKFKVINYEFPNINNGTWDSNWLIVDWQVYSKFGNWHTISPTMLTFEIYNLMLWFDDLSKNMCPEDNSIIFVDHDWRFELLNEYNAPIKKIRIKYNVVLPPEELPDSDGYYVDIFANDEEMRRIALDLRSEVARFPVR